MYCWGWRYVNLTLLTKATLENDCIFSERLCRCDCGDRGESEKEKQQQRAHKSTKALRKRKVASHNGLDQETEGVGTGAREGWSSPPRKCERCNNHWKPLLLVIPLRLGLSEMNSVYHSQLKVGHVFIATP